MPVQLNVFLLLFGGLQGILLSLFLVRRKSSRKASFLLAAYVAVLILQLALKVASKVWLLEHARLLYNISYRLPLLYGPLVYLLARHILPRDRDSNERSALHFVPFVASIALLIAGLRFQHGSLYSFLFQDIRTTTGLQLGSIIIYHAIALRLWWLHRDKYSRDIKWLGQFISISALVTLAITVTILIMYTHYPELSSLRWGFTGLSVFICWIGFHAIHSPEILAVNPYDEPVPVPRSERRYSNSGLTDVESGRIIQLLDQALDRDRLYLSPDLSIDELSNKIDCSRHHLSQVLNEKYGQSFYEIVNARRVAHAQHLLSDPRYRSSKIAAVAFDSGFSSISSFNDVFKKRTGMTPSAYRAIG